MKKLIMMLFFSIIFLGMGATTYAQNSYRRKSLRNYRYQHRWEHHPGSVRAHVGIGFPSVVTTGTKNIEKELGEPTTLRTPPLHVSAEMGISNKFSVGAQFAFTSENIVFPNVFENNPDFGWKQNFFIMGLKGSYHFNGGKNKRFDPYVSAMLGYNLSSYTINSTDQFYRDNLKINGSGFAYSANVGFNFLFTRYTGAFIEAGYGITYGNIGLTFGL